MRLHYCVTIVCSFYLFFFFFQAEDGIRDVAVTGVQTCALPISWSSIGMTSGGRRSAPTGTSPRPTSARSRASSRRSSTKRSEERRVGKECRSRWAPDHEKKKKKEEKEEIEH